MARRILPARSPGSRLRVTLPEHDGFVPQCGVQWWYWTAHFQTDAGRRYGCEVVFFAFKKWGGFVATLCHQALTDIDGKRFSYDQHTRPFQLPRRTPGRFDLTSDESGAVVARGGDGRDHLRSRLGGTQLDLQLTATRAPTVHYEGNAHPYLAGGYTLYYARERMELVGTLTPTPSARPQAVRGTAWFDRQYGELLPAIAVGWQWFAMNLLDGVDLMVFLFPGRHHASESFASMSDAQGRQRVLTPDDFVCHPTGEWASPHTGIRYPSGWQVHVPSEHLHLQVTPQLLDQELHGYHEYWPGPEYWEGACEITHLDGRPAGSGYVELDGYGRSLFGRLDTD